MEYRLETLRDEMMNARRLVLLATFSAMVTSVWGADDARDSKEKLTGTWVAESVQWCGDVIPGRRMSHNRFVFEKNRLILKRTELLKSRTGDEADDRDVETRIVIDDTRKPATIDIIFLEKVDGKELIKRAIYKFDDDRLMICHLVDEKGEISAERPTTFESSPTVRGVLTILKRKS